MYFVGIGLGTHPCKISQNGSEAQAGMSVWKKMVNIVTLSESLKFACFNYICPRDRW